MLQNRMPRSQGSPTTEARGIVIAVNKWDAIEKDDKTIYKFTNKVREVLSFMPYAEIMFISAKTGQRIPRLFETIDMVLEIRLCAFRQESLMRSSQRQWLCSSLLPIKEKD